MHAKMTSPWCYFAGVAAAKKYMCTLQKMCIQVWVSIWASKVTAKCGNHYTMPHLLFAEFVIFSICIYIFYYFLYLSVFLLNLSFWQGRKKCVTSRFLKDSWAKQFHHFLDPSYLSLSHTHTRTHARTHTHTSSFLLKHTHSLSSLAQTLKLFLSLPLSLFLSFSL